MAQHVLLWLAVRPSCRKARLPKALLTSIACPSLFCIGALLTFLALTRSQRWLYTRLIIRLFAHPHAVLDILAACAEAYELRDPRNIEGHRTAGSHFVRGRAAVSRYVSGRTLA